MRWRSPSDGSHCCDSAGDAAAFCDPELWLSRNGDIGAGALLATSLLGIGGVSVVCAFVASGAPSVLSLILAASQLIIACSKPRWCVARSNVASRGNNKTTHAAQGGREGNGKQGQCQEEQGACGRVRISI